MVQIQLSIPIMDPKMAYVCNYLMFLYVVLSVSLPLCTSFPPSFFSGCFQKIVEPSLAAATVGMAGFNPSSN